MFLINSLLYNLKCQSADLLCKYILKDIRLAVLKKILINIFLLCVPSYKHLKVLLNIQT